MSSVNTFAIEGRLTRDCEVRELENGRIISFSIATNRSRKEGDQWVDETDYFDCSHYTKGMKIQDHLTKGQQVFLAGDLRQDRWEDKETGKPHSKVKLNVSRISLGLGGKGASKGTDKTVPSPAETEDAFNDDIPF
jgi:single-strand DNA-binding protein